MFLFLLLRDAPLVKIQDVFSLVSIDEFTSAVRGYKNSRMNFYKKFNRICSSDCLSEASCCSNEEKIVNDYAIRSIRNEITKTLFYEICGGSDSYKYTANTYYKKYKTSFPYLFRT